MSLTALPPELIIWVVAKVESTGDLCSLARCSRQLKICTIPLLYHQVTILEEVSEGEPQVEDGKLQQLASLLLRQPDLAGLVRHFKLEVRTRAESSDCSDEEFDEFEYLKHFAATDEPNFPKYFYAMKLAEVDQAFVMAVKASSLSQEEETKWLRQLSNKRLCNDDMILTLLLPALLKVKTLVLDVKIGFYLERMIRRVGRRERPFDTQAPFQALRFFQSSKSHELSHSRTTGFIASLIELPAIEELSYVLFGNALDDHYAGEDKSLDKNLIEGEENRRSSPVTSLDLAIHQTSKDNLGHILRAPRALKTFSYTAIHPTRMNFAHVRQVLWSQRNCLESLCLGYDEEYETFNRATDPGICLEPMESFMIFKDLKVFKIVALFLRAILVQHGIRHPHSLRIFPLSLERLHLVRFRAVSVQRILEMVESLVAHKSSNEIPLLEELILEEPRNFLANRPVKLVEALWGSVPQPAIGRLSRVAAAQGVY